MDGAGGASGPATPPSVGKLTNCRSSCPPLPSFQALTHLVPPNVSDEDTETQRVTWGGVEVHLTPGRCQTVCTCFPEGGREGGLHSGQWKSDAPNQARRHPTVCLPPPTGLTGKMPALCGTHSPLCDRRHPGGGRAALTMQSLALPPAPRLDTCLTLVHMCSRSPGKDPLT